MKRVVNVGAIAAGVVVVVVVVFITIGSRGEEAPGPRLGATQCQRDSRTLLAAQSVPGAQLVPCLTDEAAGWSLSREEYSNDGTRFTLTAQNAPGVEWTISFTTSCLPLSTRTVSRPGAGGTVYEETSDVPEADNGTRRVQWMVFGGGCVVSSVVVPGRIDLQHTLDDVDELLALVSRSVLDRDVNDQTDGTLRLDAPHDSQR